MINGKCTGHELLVHVLSMKGKAVAAGKYGPYFLCMAIAWRPYLRRKWRIGHAVTPGGWDTPRTVRERLLEIDGMLGVVFTDSLRGWDTVLHASSFKVVSTGSVD